MSKTYILTKQFNAVGIGGECRLPIGTKCVEINHIIYHDKTPICYDTSQNAFEYFTYDNNGDYQIRRLLIDGIIQVTKNILWNDNKSFLRVLNDKYAQRFHKPNLDSWVWNRNFYTASIDDLLYLCKLLSIKVELEDTENG